MTATEGRDGPARAARRHVHATIDHLDAEASAACALNVRLDRRLMERLGASVGSTVRIATQRGRSLAARLAAPKDEDEGRSVLRCDRFVRQALKAHMNADVEVETIELSPAVRVELRAAIDVSMAHDLVPHLKKILVERRAPASLGAVYYVPFAGSQAGTTYEISKIEGPGVVAETTEISIAYPDSHLPEGAFDVTYEDVGGLAREITLLRELIQLPLRFPSVYRHLGISPPRGVILYGPPGAGKTHLARAVANEVDARFYMINGPDVIGSYSGETEANLRRMFSEASHHAPSIVFIDELDAIAPKRGETGAHADVRAVTQLLSLMDGLTRVDSVMVIGTTNRIDAVDPAFRRPGRFDREIFVGPPNVGGRREILGVHTREMPLSSDALAFLEEVARRTHGFLGADLMELCRDAGLHAMRRRAGDLEDHRGAFRISTEGLEVERRDFEAALSQVRPSALRETFITIPDVQWSDIGGLEDAKRRLREAVELPLRNPGLLAASGLSSHGGVLLHGPSGTGKTLLARAIAHECGVNFISIDGPEVFNKWLGESEEGVRQVFRVARQVSPAVIFFDQLDAIAPTRGVHLGSMTTDRVVSQLLAELDGVGELSGVVVIGASNRKDLIDPSILRPGRFGTHIEVDMPDAEARAEIARIGLKTAIPDAPQISHGDLRTFAEEAVGLSGADIRALCDEAKRIALRRTGYSRPVAPSADDLFEALRRRLR